MIQKHTIFRVREGSLRVVYSIPKARDYNKKTITAKKLIKRYTLWICYNFIFLKVGWLKCFKPKHDIKSYCHFDENG